MPLVIKGTIVTFDGNRRIVDDGAIYVGDDGLIVDVREAREAPPDGFAGARQVSTRGVVYPGLIDLHSHLMYNSLPLWREPGRAAPYGHHDQWPRAETYGPRVSQPGQLLGLTAGRALLSYVEAKAIVGGTTTIQGNPKGSRPPDGALVRNVDTEAFGTRTDFFLVSTLVQERPALVNYASALGRGQGFIYHLCEGVTATMQREWEAARDAGVLHPRFIGIHATFLGPDELAHWASRGGTMVWSPFSNLWLYGATADVAAAKAAGLRLCLGSDWAPSGTKNVLGELKVADLWNRAQPVPIFSDADLCELVTANPGDALAQTWGPRLGRLEAGRVADIVVMAANHPDRYRNLIAARERDVRLVLVGGQARYGMASLMKAAGASGDSAITLGSLRRRIVLGPTAASWSEVLAELEAVRRDPIAAKKRADEALAAWGGPLDDPRAPFTWLADMPRGLDDDSALGGPGDPPNVVVPPLQSLVHDRAWFDAVDAHPFHAGLLSGLRAYYA